MTEDSEGAPSLSAADVQRLAKLSTDEMNAVLTRLLIDAVAQITDEAGSFRHEESTVYLWDRAREALEVPYATAENVVAALARMSGAILIELCKVSGIDPKAFVVGYAEDVERLTREQG
jgi:hypothetical protein